MGTAAFGISFFRWVVAFAREVATRVLFFADGIVTEDGTPEEIFVHPKSPRLREFLSKLL